MSGIRAALGRFLRRAAIVVVAALLGGAVGVVAKARADEAGDGTRYGGYETVRDAPGSDAPSPASRPALRIVR